MRAGTHVKTRLTAVAMQSHKGHVAEYELVSGTKLGSSEVGHPPIALQYTSDASTLIGITEVRPPPPPFFLLEVCRRPLKVSFILALRELGYLNRKLRVNSYSYDRSRSLLIVQLIKSRGGIAEVPHKNLMLTTYRRMIW